MELELNSKEPIYIQIKNYMKMKIVSGELKKGERLLSVRDYASELKVNPNTILINTQRGIGKFLTEDETIIDNLRKEYSKELLRDFIHKSKTLGFSKEEILELIMNMYEEE